MDLSVAVYQLTTKFPNSESYRLTSQVTRAVVSVPANIAEGHARSTAKDFGNFLAIARGSLAETETFILLAVRLAYLTEQEVVSTMSILNEVGRVISALRKRIAPR